jgi:hypothetical protein
MWVRALARTSGLKARPTCVIKNVDSFHTSRFLKILKYIPLPGEPKLAPVSDVLPAHALL